VTREELIGRITAAQADPETQDTLAQLDESMSDEEKRRALLARLRPNEPVGEQPGGLPSLGEILTGIAGLITPSNPLGLADPLRHRAATGVYSTTVGVGQALAEIPGIFTDKELITDKVAQTIRRHRMGLVEESERYALNAGFTSGQIATAGFVGDMVGFLAPGAASVKIASWGLRAPILLRRYPLMGNFLIDSVAGAVYGGLFSPDATDIPKRLQSMAVEGGIGGALGLVFRGPASAVVSYRYTRAIQRAKEGEVQELLQLLAKAKEGKIALNERQADLAIDLLSEEQYLVNSPAAQQILQRSADELALVQGIIDAAGAGHTSGVLRGVSDRSILERLQGEFPNLKFDAVRRGDAAETAPVFDIFFGTKGLNNRQRAQLKKEGRFEGQRVIYGGAELEYVGLGDSGRIKLRRLDDGKEIFVKPENVTDLAFGTPPDERAPRLTALWDDFRSWFLNRANLVADARSILTEQQIAQGLRDGTLSLDMLMRRELNIPGGIVDPKDTEGLLTKVLDPETGRPKTVLHGTPHVYDQMEVEKSRYGLYGRGLYFSDSPELANSFAQQGFHQVSYEEALKEIQTNLEDLADIDRRLANKAWDDGRPMTPQDEVNERALRDYIARQNEYLEKFISGQMAPNVRIAQLDIRNPFPLSEESTPEIIDKIFESIRRVYANERPESDINEVIGYLQNVIAEHNPEAGPVLNETLYIYLNMALERLENGPSWMQGSADDAIRILRDAGYDGLHHTNPDGSNVWIAWENSQVYLPGEMERIFAQAPDMVHELTPPELWSFEELVDEWMKERNLPLDAVDAQAVRIGYGVQMRNELWQALPEEEKAILDRLRDEYMELLEFAGDDVQLHAQLKGFHADRNGTGWVLRDINTGASIPFDSDEAALAAIRKVQRVGEDYLQGILPDGMPTGSLAAPGDMPDADWLPEGVSPISAFGDATPVNMFRNIRDYLIGVEERTGIPLWSQGFEKIDQGLSRMRNEYMPWARQIEEAFSGLNRKDRIKIAEYWQQIEGKNLTKGEEARIAKSLGLSGKHLSAARKARQIWDAGFALSGMDESRYIEHYFSRMMPWARDHGGIVDLHRIFPEGVPPEVSVWFEMSRTGEMAITEMDPAIVMHKWFRTLFFKTHVKEHWDRVAQLVGHGHGRHRVPPMRVRDLTPEQRQRIQPELAGLDDSATVLPEPLIKILSEYLTIVRGFPNHGMTMSRDFMRRFMKSLGIEGDPRIVDEYINTGMSTMYGAAMGLRPALLNRDFTQNIWMLYTRIGGKDIISGMEAAFTREGFEEALAEGAIRMSEANVPYGDVIYETIMEGKPVGTGPASWAIAGVMRLGLRIGEISRRTAQKFMTPYAHTGHMNRAWAYHSQKNHTARWLDRFESGQISQAVFEDEGLAFFSKPIREEFMNIYNKLGRERALRFIGKMGADEANFIYGVGAQPAWMQSTFGRFVGMFGTYPMWAMEMYFRRFFNASPKQKALFVLRNAAATLAMANIALQTGVNMWNWIAPASWANWGGGPMVQHLANVSELISAPAEEKAGRAKALARDFSRLAFPGQVFLNDVSTAMDQRNPMHGALLMMLGRPVDQGHWAMENVLSPNVPVTSSELISDPAVVQWLDKPTGSRRTFSPEEMGFTPSADPVRTGVRTSVRSPTLSPDELLNLLDGNR